VHRAPRRHRIPRAATGQGARKNDGPRGLGVQPETGGGRGCRSTGVERPTCVETRRTFLQRCEQGPVAASVEACHPWRRLVFEVARSPASPSALVRRWPFGRSRRAVRRHRRQLHGLSAWARAGIFGIPPRRLLTLASPSAFSPSRAGSAPLSGWILPLLELRPLLMAHLPMAP